MHGNIPRPQLFKNDRLFFMTAGIDVYDDFLGLLFTLHIPPIIHVYIYIAYYDSVSQHEAHVHYNIRKKRYYII